MAAAALLGESGPSAVTARAAATRAGVPLAAVSYYFSSVDELVGAAAQALFDGFVEAGAALVAQERGRTWEQTLVRVWLDPSDGGPDPARVRGTLQQLASAAVAPSLAPSLQRWDARLVELVEEVLRRGGRDTSRARVLLAALDGFTLARLCGVDVAGGSRPVQRDDTLLDGLVADLRLILDDLAPEMSPGPRTSRAPQNSRAVGSSRPDSPT